jgi:hypothetical protein
MVNGRFRERMKGGRLIFIHNFLMERHDDHGHYVPSVFFKPSLSRNQFSKAAA